MPLPGPHYSLTAKTLHWITAAAVIVMVPLGLYMVRRGAATNFDNLTNTLYSAHKLIGFLLLWVVAARILNRLRGAPPPAETLTPLERVASSAVHHLLYLLLPIVPLLGWAGVSAYGARDVFGWFSLPPLLPESSAGDAILAIHGVAALTLAALAVLHIGGALMHGFIKRDGVMNRMIGWWPLRR
ncbi:MAG: cytochrome B [Rhizobiales bacterium 65-9]|nr:cytochrome b [Hyphomicrobiales bacterium]OJY34728.1 MAG: cytochrome B [Rhizobiales bacterium 65-9]